MRPRLIHPVQVVVAQVDPAGQTLDPDFGTPQGTPARIERHLHGQVRLTRGQQLQMTPGGASPLANAIGQVVFERAALERASVKIQPGDVITQVDGAPVRYRVLRVDPHGTYGGRTWLVMAVFGAES